MKTYPCLAVPALALSICGCSGAAARPAPAPRPGRAFHFEYSTTVAGFAPDAKNVRIWLPLPQSDENQEISNLKVEAPVPYRETKEALYGNRLAYLEVPGSPPSAIAIKVAFDVRRVESSGMQLKPQGQLLQRLLEGDHLAPLGGEAEARAVQAVAKRSDIGGKARGLYDRVLADVAYDKTGTGWGKGDLAYVCSAGKGNCSDFHALFISMARSQHIPALFEIGFPIPKDKKEGVVAGYHCWAWYQEAPGIWRPVDISEADKDASKTDYYFGTLCANRVALSRGRDLLLEPPQAGEPVNFLIYPYVEVDGKVPEKGVEKAFSFREI